MPNLVNSFLRIQFSEKKARELLSERFSERGWDRSVVRELKLLFVPRYHFEYCIVSEEGGENKRYVSDLFIEKDFFNPITKELVGREQFSESALTNEFQEGVEFSVLPQSIKRNDAKKIVKFLLSKEKKCPCERIDLLNFSLYYIPVWHVLAEIEKQEFKLEISAFNGEIKELTPIPEKQRPWPQAVNETITDLKEPRNWLSYFGQMLSSLFIITREAATNRYARGFFRALWRSRSLQLIILLIILFALLYFAVA